VIHDEIMAMTMIRKSETKKDGSQRVRNFFGRSSLPKRDAPALGAKPRREDGGLSTSSIVRNALWQSTTLGRFQNNLYGKPLMSECLLGKLVCQEQDTAAVYQVGLERVAVLGEEMPDEQELGRTARQIRDEI
jgi:hypothetical protein